MFIKQQNIIIKIIYMTTDLEQNSSKPSIFQRNTAEKARFHSTNNFFNYKTQTIQQSHTSSESSAMHGKTSWCPEQFLPFVRSDRSSCPTLGSLKTLFSLILIVIQGVTLHTPPLLLRFSCTWLQLRLEGKKSHF